MAYAWLNGTFVPESTAHVAIGDAGFLHGVGVFTTMRAAGGRACHLDRHLKRLRDSCEALFIPLQAKDVDLADAVAGLLERNGLVEGRLRLTATRGVGREDPLHGRVWSPTLLLTAGPATPYPREAYALGMMVAVVSDWKLNPYDLGAGHKTLDYLSRMAALKNAAGRGAGEALWFDVHHFLQSGCVSNVFLVKEGRLHTPVTGQELRAEGPLRDRLNCPASAVLPGVMRGVVIESAEGMGLEVERSALTINEVLSAEEIFLTNSIMGVMPVTKVEAHVVGTGRVGELTRRLMGLEGMAG